MGLKEKLFVKSEKNLLAKSLIFDIMLWYVVRDTSNIIGRKQINMAKVCYFTGRKTVSGNNRSHAMNQTKRRVKPNLQKVTVLIDGKPKKVWASARALKSGKVERV